MAAGDEILIVDSNDAHRSGMAKLFEGQGYVVTAVATATDARDRVQTKFFPVALVDLDVDQTSAGLDVVRFIRQRSPETGVVLLTSRRSFEGAVDAMRAGCIDVIIKTTDQVPELRRKVELACDRLRTKQSGGETAILEEVKGVLDLAFQTMLTMARSVYHDISVGALASFRPRVLFVESEQQMVMDLSELVRDKNWDLAAAISGGDALDKAGSTNFDLVVVRDELPDLPGPMVLRTLQARRAEMLGLLYNTPGQDGRIERYGQGRTEQVIRPFTSAKKLVEECDAMVGRLASTQRDRRVIQAFRTDHEDFFRRYAELKLRIDRMLS